MTKEALRVRRVWWVWWVWWVYFWGRNITTFENTSIPPLRSHISSSQWAYFQRLQHHLSSAPTPEFQWLKSVRIHDDWNSEAGVHILAGSQSFSILVMSAGRKEMDNEVLSYTDKQVSIVTTRLITSLPVEAYIIYTWTAGHTSLVIVTTLIKYSLAHYSSISCPVWA